MEKSAATLVEKKRIKFNIAPYIMIIPIFVLLAIFAFYPIGLSIVKSFYRWSGTFSNDAGINKFIGFDNYIALFKDEIFIESWKNVLFFIVTGVIVNTIFPFLAAVLIFNIGKRFPKKSFAWRVAFVVPMIVPTMVVFLLWGFIYDVKNGVVNNILELMNLPPVDLLGNSSTVKWAIRFMGFPWCGGTNLLIFLAGLSSIDDSLREAAMLDGAGKIKKLFKIDVPLCKPQFKMVITLSIIGEIQDFVKVQTLTEGGPGYSSYVPALYMYNTAFASNEYGRACAMGVVMLVVMLICTFVVNMIFKSGGSIDEK